jgi:putative phage-type endonuclease
MPTITARDFSSILNLNPYESPYECLKNKICKKVFCGNKFTEHGNKYESIAIKMYEKQTGNKVETQQFSCKHPEYEWITGRVDGITVLNKQSVKQKKRKLNTNIDCIVEIKCPFKKPVEKLSLKNIPIYYWMQCQVYMNILNYNITHYVEFYIDPENKLDEGELIYLEIERDKKWWTKVMPKIKLFYKDVIKYHTLGNLENHPIKIKEKEWEEKFKI